MRFCSYVIFLLRNQWLIEGLSEAMGAALVGNNFSPIFILKKTKWLVAAQNLQSIKTLLTLELSQYCKSGSMFSSSEPVASSSDWSRLGNALCLYLPIMIRPAHAVPESGSKSLAVSLNLRLHSVTAFREIARWQAGAQTWTQTWTLLPDQQVVKVFKFIASKITA